MCWFEVIWIGFMNSGARLCKVLGRRPLCAMCLGLSWFVKTGVTGNHWERLESVTGWRTKVISSIGSALDFVHSKGTARFGQSPLVSKQAGSLWVIVIGFEFLVEKKWWTWQGCCTAMWSAPMFCFQATSPGTQILLSSWKNNYTMLEVTRSNVHLLFPCDISCRSGSVWRTLGWLVRWMLLKMLHKLPLVTWPP